MSRDGEPDPQRSAEQTIDRIAHAFTPAHWKGRSLAVAVIVFVAVAALTVVQRALLADSPMGWVFTAVHGLIVVLVVPTLTIKAVREWRAVQQASADTGLDQPRGVPE